MVPLQVRHGTQLQELLGGKNGELGKKPELSFFMMVEQEPLSKQLRNFLRRYTLFGLNKLLVY